MCSLLTGVGFIVRRKKRHVIYTAGILMFILMNEE